MTALVAVRWRRFGKDRVYINEAASNAALGWFDLKTGTHHLEPGADRIAFEHELAQYLAANRITLPQPVSSPGVTVTATAATVHGSLASVHVQRWRRFGQDRLYVKDLTGQQIGWLDLTTGRSVIENPSLAQEFRAALEQYCAEHHLGPRQDADPHARAAAGDPTPGWDDLSQNRAGQAAHEQALNEYARWQRGAEGEIAIGASLDSLTGEGWRTLHSVPIGDGRADVDHITIGPGGIFSVNSKNHLGHQVTVTARGVYIDGKATRHVQASRLEGERAGYLLSHAVGFLVRVDPLIVVLADAIRVKEQPSGVTVLARGEVDGWLSRLPTHYSAEHVAHIWDQARRSSTWQPHR